MFIKRTISGLILTAVTFWLIFFAPFWLYSFIVLIFIYFALSEFYGILIGNGQRIYKFWGKTFGLILPLVIYLNCLRKGILSFPGIELIIISFFLSVLFIQQFTCRKNNPAVISIACSLLGVIYISWPLSILIFLRNLEHGAFWIFYLILVVKVSDTGSFISGSLLGRHKLIPRISPNKSIEGVLGGVLFSFISSLSVGYLLFTRWGINIIHFVILGIILSGFGQFGDLAESLIKRDCAVKDSGKGIPGLGGVLDLVDSLLIAIPVFYLYFILFIRQI
jgi:phosphatidate cytidylyltransferase